jgi:hypothetical protein
MAEETPVTGPSRIKFKGIFSLDRWYRLMYDLYATLGYEINEKKFKESHSGSTSEMEIIWECEKKVDDYTVFFIKTEILIQDHKRVKVQKEGVDIEANSGDVTAVFRCSLVTDYENRWESHPVLKFLKGIYDKYLYRATFEFYKDKIYEEMYTVQNEVKAFFNLSRFM